MAQENKKPTPTTKEISAPQTHTWLGGLFFNILNEMPVSISGFWERHPGKSFWDITEEMMADPHIQSVFRSRKAGVAGRAWEVVPADDSSKAQQIAIFVKRTLRAIPNFEYSLNHLLKAVAYGHSVAEIMWRIDSDAIRCTALKTRRPDRFTLGKDNVLRLLDSDTGQNKELPGRKFICHKHDPQDDIPYATPLLVSVYWPWFFKKHAHSFWMIVAEKFGVPSIVGRYPAHYTDTDVRDFVRALMNLQQDSVAAVPQDTTIDMEIAKTSVGERGSFFGELLEFCNSEISKAVLGGTLTQEVGDVGSYAASKTHQEVRQDIIEEDARLLQSTIDATLISWLVDMNYGPDATQELCPSFLINVAPDRGTAEFASTIKTLTDAGLRIPTRFVHETFGIPEPQENEETLRPSQPQGPIFREEGRPFEPGKRGR